MKTADLPPQRIIRLEASNFKRLVAVDIKPDGSVYAIAGKNGAGKSSCLDAIEAALGGAKHSPEQPIRRGANKARVVLELDDLIVTRKWSSKGDALTVESKDGERILSPQTVLDRLTSAVSFDPLAFTRLKPREQAEQLRALAGLDTSKLDEERRRVYASRRAANAEVEFLESQLAAVKVPSMPAEIGEEVDIVAIAEKKRQADKVRAENGSKRAAAVDRAEEVGIIERVIFGLRNQIAERETALEAAILLRAKAEQDAHNLVDPDITAIDSEIAAARSNNRAVQERQRQADAVDAARKQAGDVAKRIDAARVKADELDSRIRKIDAEKADMLASAKFPLPGLSADEDGVSLNGVPFSQASQAEKIRVGVAMGAALNPKFRTMLCRDGSLLDADSLRIVAELARVHDLQLLIETVGQGEGCGVLIENGCVAGQDAQDVPAETESVTA